MIMIEIMNQSTSRAQAKAGEFSTSIILVDQNSGSARPFSPPTLSIKTTVSL